MSTMLLRCKDDEEQMVSMSYFNEHIVFNIFTRFPADILQKKIKYQCRSWFHLVSNPFFVETHLHQSEDGILFGVNIKLLFVDLKGLEAYKVKVRKIQSISSGFLVRGICNGLILLEVPENKFYVTNPTTKETILLPTYIQNSSIFTPITKQRWDLVFVPSTKAYKVLELLYDCVLGSYVFRILSLCTSPNESWRPIKELGKSAFTSYERISINGILYMHSGSSSDSIVSFDVGDETTTRLLPLPKCYHSQWLIKMEGLPTLIGSNKWPQVDFDVWILKDVEWVKKLSFCVSLDVCKVNYEKKVLGSLNNGEVILFEEGINRSRILIFYVKTKLWKAVDIFKREYEHIHGTHGTLRVPLVANFFKGTHVNSMVSFT